MKMTFNLIKSITLFCCLLITNTNFGQIDPGEGCFQECNPTPILSLSTGVDAFGNQLPCAVGTVDPVWRLINNPPIEPCTNALITTINGNAFVMNHDNITGSTTWANQPGVRTIAPVDGGCDTNFGCNNLTNANGDYLPYIFERTFCVCQPDEFIIDVGVKGDDQVILELWDLTNSTLLATSPVFGFANGPALTWNHGTFLPVGTYAIRANLANISSTVLGFSVSGNIFSASQQPVIIDNNECCVSNTINVRKILDLDCDGEIGANDQIGAGWDFQLIDAFGNIVQTGTTNINGELFFNDVLSGTYIIRELPQSGWTFGNPSNGMQTITVSPGSFNVVNFFNCPAEVSPCDDLEVRLTPTGNNGCCYSIDLANNYSGNIVGLEANILTPDWIFNTASVNVPSGWGWSGIPQATQLTLTHNSGSIPVGLSGGVLDFCLAETASTAANPQQIEFIWYEQVGNDIVAVCDTVLLADCIPGGQPQQCAEIINSTVECEYEDGVYKVTFEVQNNHPTSPATNVMLYGSLGYSFRTTPTGPDLSSFIVPATIPPAGGTSGPITVYIYSPTPITSPTNIYFNYSVWGQDFCCHVATPHCIQLPVCDCLETANFEMVCDSNKYVLTFDVTNKSNVSPAATALVITVKNPVSSGITLPPTGGFIDWSSNPLPYNGTRTITTCVDPFPISDPNLILGYTLHHGSFPFPQDSCCIAALCDTIPIPVCPVDPGCDVFEDFNDLIPTNTYNTTSAGNWQAINTDIGIFSPSWDGTPYLQANDNSNGSWIYNDTPDFSGDWTLKGCELCFDYNFISANNCDLQTRTPMFYIYQGASPDVATMSAVFRLNTPITAGSGWHQQICMPVETCMGAALPSNATGSWTWGTGGADCNDFNALITGVSGIAFFVDNSCGNQTETHGFDNFCFQTICDDECCDDEIGFQTDVQAGYTYTLDPTTCSITLTPNALDSCYIYNFDWGDGSSAGPFTVADFPITYTYGGTGGYAVCMNVREVDENGNVCWSDIYCEQFFLECSECCDDEAGFQSDVAAGYSYTLDPATCSITLTPNALDSCYSYMFDWGDGTTSGLFTASDFPLTYSYSGSGGYAVCMYVQESKNGAICWEGQFCDQFFLECGCCSSYQAFCDRVDTGFLVAFNDPTNCTIGVSPLALNECDQVLWSWGDGSTSGPVPHNVSVTHAYTTPGTYTVCMIVREIGADGTVCWEKEYCETITVECEPECCTDQAAFDARVNSFLFSIPDASNNCTMQVGVPGLTDCDQVTWIWGDGTTTGPLPGTSAGASHVYTAGNYTVCMLVEEVDAVGNVCWEKEVCYQVTADCEPECCIDQAAFDARVNSFLFSIPSSSNNCTMQVGVNLTECDRVTWIWGDGTTTGPLPGTSANTTHTYTAGTYTVCMLVEEVDAAGNVCWSKEVCYDFTANCDPIECCPDFDTFCSQVDAGFTTFISGTTVTANPVNPFPECYQVSWIWGNEVSSLLNTHTFQNYGLYKICMVVVAIDPITGEICHVKEVCKRVWVIGEEQCPPVIDIEAVNTPDGFYRSGGVINYTGTVGQGGNVEVRAGEIIQLEPGFSVGQGANFSAIIEPCDTTIPCWDGNQNGSCEDLEDTNRDGVCDSEDCGQLNDGQLGDGQ